MNLESLPREAAPAATENVQIIEVITPADIFPVTVEPKSRRIKASCYTRRGYRGFVFVRDGRSIGDIWYAPCGPQASCHRDLKWLGIHPRDGGVYLFDMYLHPHARGMGISARLLKAALCRLRDAGFRTAYGFYWFDNLSALWVHRMLKYEEIDKRRGSAIFSLRRSFRRNGNEAGDHGTAVLKLPKAGA